MNQEVVLLICGWYQHFNIQRKTSAFPNWSSETFLLSAIMTTNQGCWARSVRQFKNICWIFQIVSIIVQELFVILIYPDCLLQLALGLGCFFVCVHIIQPFRLDKHFMASLGAVDFILKISFSVLSQTLHCFGRVGLLIAWHP